ncbi:uncharacterized protein [Drosophila virilis]|uniref:Nucleoporin NUP35 n=1 Tax=Drosophila virilis TaxID=7244 RepID=B4LSC7_DROVI|nr:uncharacterized protein LOC6629138 [Drosophila virilis]EDW63735.1 uncharacterized protein Dvir_GJ11387 [Drosophila virilis]
MANAAASIKDMEKHSNKQYLPPFIGAPSEQTEAETTAASKEPQVKEQLVPMAVNKSDPEPNSVGMELDNPFWISVSGYQPDCAYLVYRFFLDIGHIVDKSFTETNLMYLKYFCMMDCEIALSYDGQKIGYGGDILVHVKPENPVRQTRIEPTIEKITQPAVGIAANDQPDVGLSPLCLVDTDTEKLKKLKQLEKLEKQPKVVEEVAAKQAKEKPEKLSLIMEEAAKQPEENSEKLSQDVEEAAKLANEKPETLPKNVEKAASSKLAKDQKRQVARRKLTFGQWLKHKISYIFYFY